jgi:hypothetical protein
MNKSILSKIRWPRPFAGLQGKVVPTGDQRCHEVGTGQRILLREERSSNTVTELMWRLAGGSLLRRARTLAAGARLTISLTMLVSSRNTAGHRKLTGR